MLTNGYWIVTGVMNTMCDNKKRCLTEMSWDENNSFSSVEVEKKWGHSRIAVKNPRWPSNIFVRKKSSRWLVQIVEMLLYIHLKPCSSDKNLSQSRRSTLSNIMCDLRGVWNQKNACVWLHPACSCVLQIRFIGQTERVPKTTGRVVLIDIHRRTRRVSAVYGNNLICRKGLLIRWSINSEWFSCDRRVC